MEPSSRWGFSTLFLFVLSSASTSSRIWFLALSSPKLIFEPTANILCGTVRLRPRLSQRRKPAHNPKQDSSAGYSLLLYVKQNLKGELTQLQPKTVALLFCEECVILLPQR